MLKGFAAVAGLCVTTVAQAEPARLSGQQISDLVAGATVEIDAPLGFKVPLRYARDGQVSGQANGLAFFLGSSSDTGKWWVDAEQICHKWKIWFNGEPQCFRMTKEGRTYHWRTFDGNTGTATIVVPAPPIQTAAVAALPSLGLARATAAPPPESARPAPSSAETPPPVPKPAVRPDAAKQAAVPSAEEKAPVKPATSPPQPAVSQNDGAPRIPPRPALARETGFMVVNVARDDVLNVRNGPSADFEVVGGLQPGSRGVTVTGACQSRWCPVEHPSVRGWVNSIYLAREESGSAVSASPGGRGDHLPDHPLASGDAPDAPRACLTPAARALLDRIEEKFGRVQVISTCRPGAMIAGTGLPSHHANGNAVDFNAGGRKTEILEWLIANHHDGGVMTYPAMDHIHVDIGRRFVSIAGGVHWNSWDNN